MRLLLVCYGVGLLLGGLSLIEWLVSRLVRLWLVAFFAGVVLWAVSGVGLFFAKRGRSNGKKI